MELNEYQQKAMTTCTESSRNVPYMHLNLGAEYQELSEKLNYEEWATTSKFNDFVEKNYSDAGLVAKAIRKNEIPCPIVPKFSEEELEGIKGELGDVLWQLSGLCSVLGFTLEDIAQGNLDKLASRKERGVIVGNGDNR